MKLDWDRKQMEAYRDYFIEKEGFDISNNYGYDDLILNFFNMYLDNSYNLNYKTKEEYEFGESFIENKKRVITIEEIIKKSNEFKYFLSICPKRLVNSILELVHYFGKNYANPPQNIDITRKKFSDEELYDQSFKIFGNISYKFILYLNNIYEHNLVKIKHEEDKFNQDSFYIPDIDHNLGYVFLNERNLDSTLESVLNHELMHSLDYSINSKVFKNWSLVKSFNYIDEAHPIYMYFYTNNKRYGETNDINYPISNYNYLNYLKIILSYFNILKIIGEIKNPSKKDIEDTLYKKLNIILNDFDRSFAQIIDANINSYLGYLISGIWALHLLEQDLDKSKRLFVNSCFNPYSNLNNFFKNAEFNLKDSSYSCHLFNRTSCKTEAIVRKREVHVK